MKKAKNNSCTFSRDFFTDVVAQMCPEPTVAILYSIDKNASRNTSDLIKVMSRISPTFNDVISLTYWRDFHYIERDHYHKVMTEEGPCFSFNSFDAKTVYRDEALVESTYFNEDTGREMEWNLESGYNSSGSDKTYPLRTLGSGVKEGLYIMLTGNSQISDKFCQGPFQGFKLTITTPGEVPLVSNRFLSIPLNQKVTVSIKPKIIFTSEGLSQYDPESRQCYFQHERYLKYFKTYTQANCELECFSNITLEQCGCVKFHMPRTHSVPVCGLEKYKCVLLTQKHYLLQEFKNFQMQNLTRCNCLPTCISIQYDAELETVSSLESFSLNELFGNTYHNKETHLTISFKEKAFKALIHSERYSLTDFVASCGGLLGLFMGVSILSLAELLSFLTIRLKANLRIRKTKRVEMKN